MKNRHELERLIGAVILPSVRPPGGLAPGAPARRPSADYLARFPPLGVIGFGRRLPDGATIEGLAEELESVRNQAPEPFFACCDLEEGAAYHFPGETRLPPARALAEAEVVRPGSLYQAGLVTGREARRQGIELVLAPVLDVNSNPANPIIGSRAFGCEPEAVAQAADAFLAGLGAAGVGASIKHFPGHGDTDVDSHLVLPRIERSLAQLESLELEAFRRVLDGAAARALGPNLTVMMGHLDVPALTGERGLATSLSKRAVAWLATVGFEGAILTDGLEMLAVANEPGLGIRALEAGCDGLLAPGDEGLMAAELLAGLESGQLSELTLRRAADNMRGLARSLPATAGLADEAMLADEPGLGVELALAALGAQPGYAAWQEALARARQAAGGAGPRLQGPRGLIEALGEPAEGDGRDGARVLVGTPGEAPTTWEGATAAVWFGPPESLPEGARDLPHLWAWAPGAAVEAAVRWLLEGQELPVPRA